MMPQQLDALADAVLDGGSVDWTIAESAVRSDERALVRRLKLVASVARVHRALPGEHALSSTATECPVPSDCWGHLRLLERIGRGSFGEVFRAWDTRLDREVALKLLPAEPSPNRHVSRRDSRQRAAAEAGSSIITEGRLLARVRHPNVVTIYGAEQIDGQVGLWMELVRGRTLEQLLAEGRVFHRAEIVEIGLELCRAVSAVHAAGVLHRDIKAHNVTRTDDGRVVLMDFGAGRELGDDSSSDLTGTPLYLAPEVLAGRPATVQSDIYSLGVLLHHLATGSYPVTGRTVAEVRQGHERGQRIGVRTVRPRLARALSLVIERACAPEPQRRYDTVEAVARGLSAARENPGRVALTYGLVAAAAAGVALVAVEVRTRWTAGPPTLAPSGSVSSSVSSVAAPPGSNMEKQPGSDLVPPPTTVENQPTNELPLPRPPTNVDERPGGDRLAEVVPPVPIQLPSFRELQEKARPSFLRHDGQGWRPARVLIDASKDGGGWWLPRRARLPQDTLFSYLSRKGADIEELENPSILADLTQRRLSVTTSAVLTGRDLVVRAGASSPVVGDEVAAYREFVASGGKLLLLNSDTRGTDPVAAAFGVRFIHSRGENRIARFIPHAITSNVGSATYRSSAGVVAPAGNVTILGFQSPDTYLDLNANDQRDQEEPEAAGALGLFTYGRGVVVFVSDIWTFQPVPQPLTDNIFSYLLDYQPEKGQ